MENEKTNNEQRKQRLNLNKIHEFQNIADVATQLCQKPAAIIRYTDEMSDWQNITSGAHGEMIGHDASFCAYINLQKELFIIPDADHDPRFAMYDLVSSPPNFKFIAGIPLILSNHQQIGTLCLLDQIPGSLTKLQQRILSLLAKHFTFIIELEMSKELLQEQMDEKDARNEALIKIANLQSHQIRQPLTNIMGLVSLIKEGKNPDEAWMKMFEIATNDFDKRIRMIVAESMADKDLKAIRFHKMVEEIDDYAIMLLDQNGNVENWNQGAEKIKGYTFDEIAGRHFSVFYTDEGKKNKLPQRLLKEAEETGVARDEGWRLRKDGSRFWGSINITAIHNERGDVIGFTKVTRDLTEITNTRDALEASEELYKMMIEQTQKVARIGGWELDVKNNLLSWTTITKEIHGVDHEYIPDLESAISFYKAGESRERIIDAVTRAIEEGTPWDGEFQIITKQGVAIWVRATGKSNYKDGICTRVYGTFQDINASGTEKNW